MSAATEAHWLIEQGAVSPGAKLPTTRDLAARLGLSRGAAVAAYETLQADGYLEARTGAGTYVAARVPRSGGCNYGPAKAYLVALSEELNLTVAARGVHVSALCPGFTNTDFHETAGLMDMKNNMAKWLWYNADVVVRDAIKGVEAGKPVVVSGRLYRWLDPIFQSVWTRRLLRIKARPE